MGMYTALEVDLKLRYDEKVLCDLSRVFFSCEDFGEFLDDAPPGARAKAWEEPKFWRWKLARMFRMDGGIAFGKAERRISLSHEVTCLKVGCMHHSDECAPTFINLFARSSYKGITHWDFIEWIEPHAASGYVKWRFEDDENPTIRHFTS